jgi:hypothetical protein
VILGKKYGWLITDLKPHKPLHYQKEPGNWGLAVMDLLKWAIISH